MPRAVLATATAAIIGVMICATGASAQPITNGLILNFQADNVDGANNATLADGQEIATWVDVPVGADNLVANNATVAGAVGFGAVGQGTPNFVAGSIPAVRFTKVIGTPNSGDALGFLRSIGVGTGNAAYTGFVVGDFPTINAVTRYIQFGDMESNTTPDRKIVGLVENGFRFNGGAQLFDPNLQTATPDGRHMASYIVAGGTDTFMDARFRLDGVEASNASTNANVSNLDDEGFVLGLGFNGVGAPIDFVDGDVNAILLYNRALSDTEIMQVEAFLRRSFAVIPEPATWTMLGLGAALLAAARRRRARM